MQSSFADFYQNNLSNKKLLEIREFLNGKKLPINEKKLNQFLNLLKKETIEKFKIKKIDFPYYHYSVYKKEQILIDVSINDKLDWQINNKSKLTIPKELKNLLTRYQKLSVKEPITFDTGYYRTKSKKTRKIEENMMFLSDKYFDILKKYFHHHANGKKKLMPLI